MGLFTSGAKAAIYKGRYKAVNFYLGGKKAAGWRVETRSGTELSWNDTYDDRILSSIIYGASAQPGTPTPSAPVQIVSVGDNSSGSGIDFTVTGNAGQSFTAHRAVVLYSAPDGTHDDYNPVTGEITRRVKRIVFDGNIFKVKSTSNYYYYTTGVTTGSRMYCTHCVSQWNYGSLFSTVFVDGGQMYFAGWTPLFPTLAEVNAWLAAQYAAGTPVTVIYKLQTPVTENITAAALPTYPHVTNYVCTAAVTASARTLDRVI